MHLGHMDRVLLFALVQIIGDITGSAPISGPFTIAVNKPSSSEISSTPSSLSRVSASSSIRSSKKSSRYSNCSSSNGVNWSVMGDYSTSLRVPGLNRVSFKTAQPESRKNTPPGCYPYSQKLDLTLTLKASAIEKLKTMAVQY